MSDRIHITIPRSRCAHPSVRQGISSPIPKSGSTCASINAGEPIAEDDDLHGASVVIDKRLESADATYGILVSDVVRQMVTRNDFVWGGVAQGVRQDGAGLGARVGLRGRFPGR